MNKTIEDIKKSIKQINQLEINDSIKKAIVFMLREEINKLDTHKDDIDFGIYINRKYGGVPYE